MINFEDYLKMVNLIELKKGIKPNSTATLDFALSYYRKQVNEAANQTDYDVRAEMVDRRVTEEALSQRQGLGNTYQIFSDKYVAKYNMPNWWELKLDMYSILELLGKDNTVNVNLPSNILFGESDEILITSETGIEIIDIKNINKSDYHIFLYIDETNGIDDKVTKISDRQFKIELIDNRDFESRPLNCKETPTKVSYVVIYL